MGTVFTIDVRDPGDWDDGMREVCAWLHHVDAVFSTYRPESELMRVRRDELHVADADPALGEVLALCGQVGRATGGFFSVRWQGGLDPTGLVKGWAIERASRLLSARGSRDHAVNGGGDVQAVGGSAPDQPWRIGITDPHDRGRVLAVVSSRDIAVATSGVGERGEHIVDPHTGAAATALASVTVTGASLTCVDAYATAAFAMGLDALEWIEAQPSYEGLVVHEDGAVRTTTGFLSVGSLR